MDWTILTGYYNAVVRWLLPIIAVLLLIICIRLLFRGKGSRTVLAVLVTDEGERLPVTAAESAIGRSAACDIQVTAPTVSRRHAVLTRDNEGFRISDIRSKGGLYVNEERVGRGARLELGDTVKLADVRLRLEAAQKEDEPEQKRRRNRPGASRAGGPLSADPISASGLPVADAARHGRTALDAACLLSGTGGDGMDRFRLLPV